MPDAWLLLHLPYGLESAPGHRAYCRKEVTIASGTESAPRRAADWLIVVSGYLALAVGLAVFFADLGSYQQGGPLRHATFTPHSVEALEARFTALDYHWPPEAGGTVPRLIVTQFPPGMASIEDIPRKKALFFRTALPIVLLENLRLERLRVQLRHMLKGKLPASGTASRYWLERIAEHYGVYGELSRSAVRSKLLRRVDTFPPALVLAQAAIESGWGTSRFALQGNALFGQWTWGGHEGMVPNQRKEGATHRVRSFPDLRASVRAYLHNLNTGGAYRELRRLRTRLRHDGVRPKGAQLAAGLQKYSERGDAYVRDVRGVIRQHGLAELHAVSLARGLPGEPGTQARAGGH